MRRLNRTLAALGWAALLAPLTATAQDDQALMERADAGVRASPTAAATNADELDLDRAEADARGERLAASVKLELVMARKAWRDGDAENAARRALTARSLVAQLPKGVDASGFARQIDDLLRRAEKRGVNLAALAGTRRVAGQTVETRAPQSRAAEPAPPGSTTPSAGGGYVTISLGGDGSSIDVEAVAEIDGARVQYQGDLAEAYGSDEVRRLVEADEARLAPATDVAYPANWPEIAARRRPYEGGEVARSRPWRDKDGKEWYAAVYDVRALIYEPPDFQSSYSLDPVEETRNSLDRQALRDRSEIFGGYAEDLAAGLPLLRAFGGNDDYFFRGAKYSKQRQQDLVEMIKAMTTPASEAKVILLDP